MPDPPAPQLPGGSACGSDASIVVQPNLSSLSAGRYRAGMLVYPDTGPSQTVNILAVIAPVSTVLFDRNGILVTTTEKEFTRTLTDERLQVAMAAGVALNVNFDVAPGMYAIRLVMRDSDGHTTARNHVVEIP